MEKATSPIAPVVPPPPPRPKIIIIDVARNPTADDELLYTPTIDGIPYPGVDRTKNIPVAGAKVQWRSELGAFAILFEGKDKVDEDSPFTGASLAIGSNRKIKPNRPVFWSTDQFTVRPRKAHAVLDAPKYTFVFLGTNSAGNLEIFSEDPFLEIEDGGGGIPSASA